MLRASLGASVGWIGISMVADGVPSLLLPHRLLADGQAEATSLGLIALVAIAVAAALQPVAGRASDRIGRAPVVAAGSVLAVAGLALMIPPDGAVPGAVMALAGVSVAQAGYQALLPERIGAAWRGRAAGMKSAFDVGGAFLGFLVLAGLLATGAVGAAVLVLSAALLVGFGAARALADRPTPAPEAPRKLSTRPDRALLGLILARFLFLLGIYVVGRFLLLFVADRHTLGADAAGGVAGAVLALLAGVTVLASLPSGWLADRIGRRPLVGAGGLLAAIGIALLPVASSVELLILFGGLMALGSAAFASASWAMLADLVAPRRAGELLGIANLGTAGAAAVAGAFGLLIDASGYEPAFVLAAACALAGGMVAWRVPEPPGRAMAVAASPAPG